MIQVVIGSKRESPRTHERECRRKILWIEWPRREDLILLPQLRTFLIYPFLPNLFSSNSSYYHPPSIYFVCLLSVFTHLHASSWRQGFVQHSTSWKGGINIHWINKCMNEWINVPPFLGRKVLVLRTWESVVIFKLKP